MIQIVVTGHVRIVQYGIELKRWEMKKRTSLAILIFSMAILTFVVYKDLQGHESQITPLNISDVEDDDWFGL